MVIVRESDRVTGWGAALRGILAATYLAAFVRVFYGREVTPSSLGTAGLIAELLLIAVFVALPVFRWYARMCMGSMILFALIYLIVAMLFDFIAVVALSAYQNASGTRLLFVSRDSLDTWLLLPHYFAASCAAGIVGAWLVCRLRQGRVVLQDGSMCPGCGYSILGSRERVCSECGREFTFQELGWTKAQFEAMQREVCAEEVPG